MSDEVKAARLQLIRDLARLGAARYAVRVELAKQGRAGLLNRPEPLDPWISAWLRGPLP
jgi:hypothetical protein